MGSLHALDISMMFFAVGTLLVLARLFGEVARHLGQPTIVGEIVAGIVLGPTCLGAIFPAVGHAIFPLSGPVANVREGLSVLAAALFLLMAGLEVDLGSVWRQGRAALSVSVAGMAIPFGVGFGSAWLVPRWLGHQPVTPLFGFALFLGTAMSISALPVIARTLRDLDVFQTDLGMLIVASAVLQDLVGWMIFAIVLGTLGGEGRIFSPGATVAFVLIFAVVMIAGVRRVVDGSLPWIHAHTSWPAGVLAFTLSLALLAAGFTEWIGVHAIFGAFLVGVAIGDSRHLRRRTVAVVDDFVSSFFAPLFFAGIGLKLDFVAHFDLGLVLFVLITASACKILGSVLGARAGGLGTRESWAVGFGMNARGAMEIILGLSALEARVIDERLFVALVVMAVLTSLASGSLVKNVLRRHTPCRLVDHLPARAFVPDLGDTTRRAAIERLAAALGAASGLNAKEVFAAAWAREELMPTGLGERVATPHARLPGVTRPAVALGVSSRGIDFDAPDGKPAQLIFLVVTGSGDERGHLEILADIARLFRSATLRQAAVAAPSGTELLALLRSGPALLEDGAEGDNRK